MRSTDKGMMLALKRTKSMDRIKLEIQRVRVIWNKLRPEACMAIISLLRRRFPRKKSKEMSKEMGMIIGKKLGTR